MTTVAAPAALRPPATSCCSTTGACFPRCSHARACSNAHCGAPGLDGSLVSLLSLDMVWFSVVIRRSQNQLFARTDFAHQFHDLGAAAIVSHLAKGCELREV